MWRLNCSEVDNVQDLTVMDFDTPIDYRYAILVSNVGDTNFTSERDGEQFRPPQATAVICKLDFSMQRYTVTREFLDDTISAKQLSLTSNLKDVTALMLSGRIHAVLRATEDVESTTIFSILSQYLDRHRPTKSALLDPKALQSSSSQVWAGLGAHIIRESYLTPVRIPVNGTTTLVKERLRVGAASLWIMVLSLVILVALTGCIILTTSQNFLPRNPWLISTDVIVKATIPDFLAQIKNCGGMRTSEITDSLRGFRFGLSHKVDFRITTTEYPQESGTTSCSLISLPFKPRRIPKPRPRGKIKPSSTLVYVHY